MTATTTNSSRTKLVNISPEYSQSTVKIRSEKGTITKGAQNPLRFLSVVLCHLLFGSIKREHEPIHSPISVMNDGDSTKANHTNTKCVAGISHWTTGCVYSQRFHEALVYNCTFFPSFAFSTLVYNCTALH